MVYPYEIYFKIKKKGYKTKLFRGVGRANIYAREIGGAPTHLIIKKKNKRKRKK